MSFDVSGPAPSQALMNPMLLGSGPTQIPPALMSALMKCVTTMMASMGFGMPKPTVPAYGSNYGSNASFGQGASGGCVSDELAAFMQQFGGGTDPATMLLGGGGGNPMQMLSMMGASQSDMAALQQMQMFAQGMGAGGGGGGFDPMSMMNGMGGMGGFGGMPGYGGMGMGGDMNSLLMMGASQQDVAGLQQMQQFASAMGAMGDIGGGDGGDD